MDSGNSYFAFISYSSKDLKYAWMLKKQLEGYQLPKHLCHKGEPHKPINHVFLDKTNIQVGDLQETLKAALDTSQYLIVVCSPNSKKSDYVAKEIRWFTRNGNEDKVFKFIIDSDPNDINTCFNSALIDIEQQTGKELLGANISENGIKKMFWTYRLPILGQRLMTKRAVMQLIAPLIKRDFAELWPYQKLRYKQKLALWVLGLLAVLSSMTWLWIVNQPFDSRVALNEATFHNDYLPPLHDAVITLTLDNDEKAVTLQTIDTQAIFANIPHRLLDEQVRIRFTAPDFLPVDTMVKLTRDLVLKISRDTAVYGNVHFTLWDANLERFIPNSRVSIAGHQTTSDAKGVVNLYIPLEEQRMSYTVKTAFPVVKNTITMPSGNSDALIKK